MDYEGIQDEDQEAYQKAIDAIRINSYNLSDVPNRLIDLRLMRFVRKRNIWAADAYCLKALKKDWSAICIDKIIPLQYPDIED